MKMVNVGVSIDSSNDDTIILSIAEARELYHQLGELLGPQGDYVDDWSETGTISGFDPIPPVTCADTGRTVWATDGAGNCLSPDELKARNRERNDKWADVGKKFAAGANQSDKPDYWTSCEGGTWRTYGGHFDAKWLDLRSNGHVSMAHKEVHALCWGDPQVTGFGGAYRSWDCVNGFTE